MNRGDAEAQSELLLRNGMAIDAIPANVLYNIPMLRIITPRAGRWLFGAGIILALSAALWVIQLRAAPPAHDVPQPPPLPPFHPEGYPIANLPATVKTLKYVVSFDMDGMGMDLLPARAGFLTREGDDYILHDWHDGHTRWRVRVTTGLGGWGQPDSGWSEINNSSFALSDDGRYFAASTVEKDGVHVRRWHDGKVDGGCVLPAPKPGYYALGIGDNGRIFLESTYDNGKTPLEFIDIDKRPPTYLTVLDGHHVIARAMTPKSPSILSGGVMAYDGKTLYVVGIKTGHLRLTPIARNVKYDFVQCSGNYLLARDGAVYTPTGRTMLPTPRHRITENDARRMSGNGYISRAWLTDQIVFSPGNNRHEIFSLATKAHWSFTSQPGLDDGVASTDGRYVLLHGKAGIKDGPNDNRGFGSGTDAVWLYERPGTLRAALRFAADRIVPFENIEDGRTVGESCNQWIFSPDGRSVILKYQYMGVGGTAVLYRW